jgi:pimeloyl-ACP methyl ester carboxylesterase
MTSIPGTFSHRWRGPAEGFVVRTDDGVRIVGTGLGEPRSDRPAVIVAHGLMGWHRKPRIAAFAERLTSWSTVFAMDLRGHGRSGGVCDYGGAEIADIEAVRELASGRGHRTIVTIGTSMGAIAAIRHGALFGEVAAVVAISSLASWDWHAAAHPRARRNMTALIGTTGGRATLRALGVRLPPRWEPPESPLDVIGKIAPTPVVLVHGTDDRLFPPVHAERLFEAAGEPKRLLLGDGFGHAEDGLTPAFAARLSRTIHEVVELPWSR